MKKLFHPGANRVGDLCALAFLRLRRDSRFFRAEPAPRISAASGAPDGVQKGMHIGETVSLKQSAVPWKFG